MPANCFQWLPVNVYFISQTMQLILRIDKGWFVWCSKIDAVILFVSLAVNEIATYTLIHYSLH